MALPFAVATAYSAALGKRSLDKFSSNLLGMTSGLRPSICSNSCRLKIAHRPWGLVCAALGFPILQVNKSYFAQLMTAIQVGSCLGEAEARTIHDFVKAGKLSISILLLCARTANWNLTRSGLDLLREVGAPVKEGKIDSPEPRLRRAIFGIGRCRWGRQRASNTRSGSQKESFHGRCTAVRMQHVTLDRKVCFLAGTVISNS